MSDQYQNLSSKITMIKHYIKDLSFENLQDINKQNIKEDEVSFSDNINAIFYPYNNDNFGILLKYNCDCILKQKQRRSFILEIDYFGLFKINKMEKYNKDDLTRDGCTLLYPLLKNIIEYISHHGAPLKISLKDSNLKPIKN